MSKIHITPKDGKEVPDPYRGGFVPPKGIDVDENDIYWQRRIADGDLDQGPPQEEETELVPEKKK